MHSLPSWLCLLPSLQELYLDGNPFQGPWQALVEPLLAKTSMPLAYPPSTPIILPYPTKALVTQPLKRVSHVHAVVNTRSREGSRFWLNDDLKTDGEHAPCTECA